MRYVLHVALSLASVIPDLGLPSVLWLQLVYKTSLALKPSEHLLLPTPPGRLKPVLRRV